MGFDGPSFEGSDGRGRCEGGGVVVLEDLTG